MGKRIKRRWLGPLAFALLVGGAGSAIADDPVDLGSPIILVDGTTVTTTGSADGVGIDEVLEEGAGLAKRAQVNMIGASVTCVDDAGNTRTNCTFTDSDTIFSPAADPLTDHSAFLTSLQENGSNELLGETQGTTCTENKIWKADATGGMVCAVDDASATPGGADTQVQFNDGGSFAGDADMVWDKTAKTFSLGLSDATTRLIMPSSNDATTPTLCWGSPCDTGLFEADNNLFRVSIGGVTTFEWIGGQFRSENNGGPAVINESASSTNPVFAHNQADGTSGLGGAAGTPSIIAGGIEVARYNTVGSGINRVEVTPAATGVAPAIGAEGSDANINLDLNAKGTGVVLLGSTTHAEIHDEDNTDVFVVNDAGSDFHSYHTNGLTSGDLSGWTFDAGGAGTSFPIASVANSVGAAGVRILVTTTGAHGLAVGDIVSQTNLANPAYVGVFDVILTDTTTTYEVTAVFTATGTGTMDQAAVLICGTGFGGQYLVIWTASGTSATNNETFDFVLYKEAATITGTKVRRKFGTAGDFGAYPGLGIVSVADGDKISLALSNEDSAGNITIRNVTIVATRL